MDEEKLKAYYKIFTDAWKLFKEYSNPDGTDEFYKRLMDKSKELDKVHESNMFRQIIIAVMDEIERIEKVD